MHSNNNNNKNFNDAAVHDANAGAATETKRHDSRTFEKGQKIKDLAELFIILVLIKICKFLFDNV